VFTTTPVLELFGRHRQTTSDRGAIFAKTKLQGLYEILGLKLRFYIISTSVLSQEAFVCYSDKMSDDINQIVSEKLDKNNFHAWKFRMTNFLMGKGFWDYVEGENEDPPKLPKENAIAIEIKAFKDWNQGARKVMYWLSVSVTDTMIGHIQDAHTLAEAWQNLVQMFQTNTKARKV
jgi:hypothetical protein